MLRENVRGECLDPCAGLKYLHAAFMICTTLVNTQTHTHRQTAFDRLHYKLSQLR